MTTSNSHHSQVELLTVEQFAKLMQVSRTTVFGWLKAGALAEGVHFIRLGRVLRFRWGIDLFFNSRLQPIPESRSPLSPSPVDQTELHSKRGEGPVNSPHLTFGKGSGLGVNLDY